MAQRRKFLFKVVVVGDGGIGKSTMIQRLITGKYIAQKITIGTDLASYSVNINNIDIRLQIWDFAGEKRFRFFLPNYSRGAHGCLLCYDITRYSSFEHLTEWYNIVHDNSDPIFILIGEKRDLAPLKRTVSQEEAKEFQKEYSIPYFYETSSKSGLNNKKIFAQLTEAILEKRNFLKSSL
ncbi:MAG: GTP-binding protein [Promethearchaeota archaeon]|nr:MAG: GTP-binding protein [Candidatus Lokiarchaeota archaeon]